jgi:hypothetical protein
VRLSCTFVLVLVAACRGNGPTAKIDVSAAPSAPLPATSTTAAPRKPVAPKPREAQQLLPDAIFRAAFWTSDSRLISATEGELVVLSPTNQDEPKRVASVVQALFARNGADRFVVQSPAHTHVLWDAVAMQAAATIDHPGGHSTSSGAVSPDGSKVFLLGCAKSAAIPPENAYRAPMCGVIYDARTAQPLGAVDAKHDLADVAFTDDSKYLLARSTYMGLSVFDAVTGATTVTRPGWKRLLEVHGWNGPDLSAVIGSQIVMGYGPTIEVFDLAEKKTIAKSNHPGKTLAVFGEKTGRVGVMLGDMDKVRVWDSRADKIIRTFDLRGRLGGGICTHCALELDGLDEDRLWVVPAYHDKELELRIGTGQITETTHKIASRSIPSVRHRLDEAYDSKAQEATCDLARRDVRDVHRIPVEYCNRAHGPSQATEEAWPYPGFDPSGKYLASIYDDQIHVLDVERRAVSFTMGKRKIRPQKPGRPKKAATP